MRILGIDPGTFKMGVGVVDSEGGDLDMVHAGVLAPRRADSTSQRLHCIFDQLSELIREWKPSAMAIEEPFAARNVKAAMAIGHAQAVAMVAAAHHGIPVSNYAPRRIKQAVTDYGGSSKVQVQEMVRVLLGVEDIPGSPDSTDALAVAICHLNASRASELAIIE